MIKSVIAAGLLLLGAALPASAHPGTGIVRDRQGNVFYTDLVHVWRIAPDGRKSIVVRDVHTHELAIDSAGNIFGEDSRYQGGDRWRHRIWRRSPDGRITDVIPMRDGFWADYGFTRDSAGSMYWVHCPERVCTIYRRTRDGRTGTVTAEPKLERQVNLIRAGADGSLYFADDSTLQRITPAGRRTALARGVGHQLMGMLPDARGDVLVASYGTRAVVRVSADGKVQTVARSPAPWGPSGVMVAPNGDLWILEYSTSNAARVRRIAANGRVTVY